MSDRTGATQVNRRYGRAIRLGLVLAIALLALIRLLAAGERPLKPLRTTATRGAFQEISDRPVLISFKELNDDPFAMQDRRLRVTGSYARLETPDCPNWKGPAIEWSIVAEDLRLNATGFETILELLPEGTILTVEGIWRLHDGPLGCGKAPPSEAVWYLEVEQILQPNPLFGSQGTVEVPTADGAAAFAIGGKPTPTIGGDPGNDGSDGLETVATPDPTPAPSPILTSTVATSSPTSISITTTPSSASATPDPATPVQTGSPTPDALPTETSVAGEPTQSGVSATSTPADGAGSTSTPFPTAPPLPTATPGGGYPGPAPTPTPSPTGTPVSYP